MGWIPQTCDEFFRQSAPHDIVVDIDSREIGCSSLQESPCDYQRKFESADIWSIGPSFTTRVYVGSSDP
eukprot:12568027-Heterocapsa_arctica.AAC.1